MCVCALSGALSGARAPLCVPRDAIAHPHPPTHACLPACARACGARALVAGGGGLSSTTVSGDPCVLPVSFGGRTVYGCITMGGLLSCPVQVHAPYRTHRTAVRLGWGGGVGVAAEVLTSFCGERALTRFSVISKGSCGSPPTSAPTPLPLTFPHPLPVYTTTPMAFVPGTPTPPPPRPPPRPVPAHALRQNGGWGPCAPTPGSPVALAGNATTSAGDGVVADDGRVDLKAYGVADGAMLGPAGGAMPRLTTGGQVRGPGGGGGGGCGIVGFCVLGGGGRGGPEEEEERGGEGAVAGMLWRGRQIRVRTGAGSSAQPGSAAHGDEAGRGPAHLDPDPDPAAVARPGPLALLP